MKADEALPGTRVRVSQEYRRPELLGMVGTVERRYGYPEYPALDVRLDDGRLELFWYFQLEKSSDALGA